MPHPDIHMIVPWQRHPRRVWRDTGSEAPSCDLVASRLIDASVIRLRNRFPANVNGVKRAVNSACSRLVTAPESSGTVLTEDVPEQLQRPKPFSA
jgi:hypothetical protein